ncbi:MAG: WHG domain-containing protein [Nocardioidaceae bacterium]
MPRAGLNRARVVAAAALLADEVGFDRLTLAALAKRLGVQLPSLYKHVAGLAALRQQLSVRAKLELADVLARATVGKARGDALRALGVTLRGWAADHPGAYAASLQAPSPGDADDVAASEAAIKVVYDVLEGYALDEDTRIDATRSLRAALDGFAALEQRGAFALTRPVDASFGWLLDSLDLALSSPPVRG